ncbi:unnamed protein product [Pieris macdunnoughi]|uniref:WDR59/RTC1-like RING zinc finger domain-containing protein n=3 Tax=Pieris TaxID=7115 RepID=A0A821NCW4_9NEOP|nr:unnamed protein product [Pieris macdunnoughi]
MKLVRSKYDLESDNEPFSRCNCKGPCVRKRALGCAVCSRVVRGLTVACAVCTHVGHADHMLKWFAQHDTCPTGCGCKCVMEANSIWKSIKYV